MKKKLYFNATKLCLDGEKNVGDWMRDHSNQIEECNREIFPDSAICERNHLQMEELTGIYVHAALITHIATWINPKWGPILDDMVQECIQLEACNFQ